MTYELVVVGCSWGGLHALEVILAGLPHDFDTPIAIVQHRRADSDDTMAQLLQRYTKLDVREVEDKDPIEPGTVYVGPPDYHVLVDRGQLALSVDEPVQFARPSIDVLFESAASAYGPAAVGVVLTGANADGAAGLARIKERGGVAVVQDPASSVRRAMPDAALAATAADAVLPLAEIPAFLYGLCGEVAS